MSRAPTFPAKPLVRRAFADAAAHYDQHAFLQREIGDRFMQRLDYIRFTPTRILDIGSGTGYVTRLAAARYPEAERLALDLAPAMLHTARAQQPTPGRLQRLWSRPVREHWLCADAEALPLADACVDLALSNLAMQWCNPEVVAREVLRVLKPGGMFMFTTFGPDTLKELRAAFRAVDNGPHVNEFIDMHDLGDMLALAGFSDPVMDQETLTLTYTELKPLLREIKGIGAHNVLPGRAPGLMGRQRWQALVDAYETQRRDGRLPATWEVVYGHAWKPTVTRRADGSQAIGLDVFKRMVKR